MKNRHPLSCLIPCLLLAGCATRADLDRLRAELLEQMAAQQQTTAAADAALQRRSLDLTHQMLWAIGGHALAARRYRVDFASTEEATAQRAADRFCALTQHRELTGAAFLAMLTQPHLPLQLDFVGGRFTTPAQPQAVAQPAPGLANADVLWTVRAAADGALELDCSVTRPRMPRDPYLHWHLDPQLDGDRAVFACTVEVAVDGERMPLARGTLTPVYSGGEGL